jgi:hypothetical protein
MGQMGGKGALVDRDGVEVLWIARGYVADINLRWGRLGSGGAERRQGNHEH